MAEDGLAEGGGDEGQVGGAAGGGDLQGGGQVLVAAGAGSSGEQGGPGQQVAVAQGDHRSRMPSEPRPTATPAGRPEPG